MKDIIITQKNIKKESIFLLGSLMAAILLNVYAVLKYNTDWSELYTQFHIILLLSVVIYVLIVLLRIIVSLVSRIIIKLKNN